jgi:hypothetical protein
METWEPSAMNTLRPFHFHRAGLKFPGRPLRQVAQDAGGEAAACVAVTGGVGRANREAVGGPVGDDAGDGVAAAVVIAEHLGEEAPDGRDRAEHAVPVLDAVFAEGGGNAGLGQGVSERQPLTAREASADRIQARHQITLGGSGRSYGP